MTARKDRVGASVRMTIDGVAKRVPAATSIAVALTEVGGSWGLFCGMGSCYECVATVDGHSGVRTCITPVAESMRVEAAARAATEQR